MKPYQGKSSVVKYHKTISSSENGKNENNTTFQKTLNDSESTSDILFQGAQFMIEKSKEKHKESEEDNYGIVRYKGNRQAQANAEHRGNFQSPKFKRDADGLDLIRFASRKDCHPVRNSSTSCIDNEKDNDPRLFTKKSSKRTRDEETDFSCDDGGIYDSTCKFAPT